MGPARGGHGGWRRPSSISGLPGRRPGLARGPGGPGGHLPGQPRGRLPSVQARLVAVPRGGARRRRVPEDRRLRPRPSAEAAGRAEGNHPRTAHEVNTIADTKTEIRDGMKIDWDVPIKMDDGLELRADVYRPVAEGRYPVILSYGPYAKGLAFQDGYPSAWQRMVEKHPDVPAGSSNKYQAWEVVHPQKWVPDGYACVRVDSRGAGRSPGYIDHFSPRETKDFYNSIEASRVP